MCAARSHELCSSKDTHSLRASGAPVFHVPPSTIVPIRYFARPFTRVCHYLNLVSAVTSGQIYPMWWLCIIICMGLCLGCDLIGRNWFTRHEPLGVRALRRRISLQLCELEMLAGVFGVFRFVHDYNTNIYIQMFLYKDTLHFWKYEKPLYYSLYVLCKYPCYYISENEQKEYIHWRMVGCCYSKYSSSLVCNLVNNKTNKILWCYSFNNAKDIFEHHQRKQCDARPARCKWVDIRTVQVW